jgi:two-component system cell cycle response regulator CtrA
MRILSVESDHAEAQSIELQLTAKNFNVYGTDLGSEGVDLGKLYDYDAILVDLNLIDMTGFDVIRNLRAAKVNCAIIVVSERGGIADKVKALNIGADDFITKPFDIAELTARIHAVVRRRKGHATSVVTIKNLTIDFVLGQVTANGTRINLTRKEYAMLELLALRKNNTISKDAFLNHLYGGMDEPQLKIIDVFLCNLRKKLRAHNVDYIETNWGSGYVLRDPVVTAPSIAPELSAMVENPPWRVPELIEQDRVNAPPLAPV